MTEKSCNCVFCLSKCPKCGSTDIEVEIIYDGKVYAYQNDIVDQIGIALIGDPSDEFFICNPFFLDEEDEGDIGIICNECDYWSESMYANDNTFKPSIAKLFGTVANMLKDYDNPTFIHLMIEYEKDGVHGFKIVSRVGGVPHQDEKLDTE